MSLPLLPKVLHVLPVLRTTDGTIAWLEIEDRPRELAGIRTSRYVLQDEPRVSRGKRSRSTRYPGEKR